MPVELGLELMAVIHANGVDAEWELFDDIIHEIDCVLLGVLWVCLQGSDARGVVNGRILKTFDRFAVFSFEEQEFHIHLDVVAGHFFS